MSEEDNLVCFKCGKKSNGATEMYFKQPICWDCLKKDVDEE